MGQRLCQAPQHLLNTMADTEINIAVKADTSQAESALKNLETTVIGAAGGSADTQGSDALTRSIERLTEACTKGTEHIQTLNLDHLRDQFDSLKGIDSEMGGLEDALDSFGSKLADISSRQAEMVDGYAALRTELANLSEAYKSGKLSADDTAATLAELTDCTAAQVSAGKQLCTDVRRLANEQGNLTKSMRDELVVYRESQTAAKEELAAFEAASEKKARMRALEKASLDELLRKVETYEAMAAEARTSGDAAAELEAAKAIETTNKLIEKKEAAQQRADQTAQAGLEKTKRAIVLQNASVEQLAQLYDKVRQKYLEAKQAQDTQGEARYLQYAKQVSDALNKKQEEADRVARALKQSARAAEKEAEDAKREAAAQEAVAQQMKLSSMKARELTEEINRLSAARKEAANAGNATNYEKLTGDLVRAKKALSEYNKEVNISKSALLNKAQAGMMAAQQLGGLAQQVRSGSVDMASMASTIMSVSMALKAGLGPIGWVMMAVQGLQMAWDYFSSSQKAAKEATEKATKALEEQNAELGRQAIAIQNAKYDELIANLKRETDAIKTATDRELRTHDTAVKADADRTSSAIRQAQIRNNARKKEMQTCVELGSMSAAEMKKESALLDAELETMQQASADKAQEASRKRLDIVQEGLIRQRNLLWKAMDDFELENSDAFTRLWTDETDKQAQAFKAQVDTLVAQLPALEKKKEDLKKRINDLGWFDSGELKRELSNTESEINSIKHQVDNIAAEFKEVVGEFVDNKDDYDLFKRNGKEFIAAALDLREKGKKLDEQKREVQQKIWENGDSIENEQLAAQLRKEELDAQKKALSLVEESNRKKEEQLEVQKQLADISSQYQTHRQYAESTELTRQQILEADKATLEAKLDNLKALRGQGGLDEISLRPLDQAIADTESQLRRLAHAMDKESADSTMKAVNNTLHGLEQQYKTGTNYARQSNKAQAQVYREDMQILRAKEKQLEQLRTVPGIDAKTEENINRALHSTREQISALKSAMSQSAANARRWIRETEPPKLQAKNRVVQGALDRLAKTYRLSAARAAKAAEKGDWKAYERAMRTMGNAEKNMGKLAKNSGQVAGYTGAMKNNVRAIADAARSGANSEKEATRAAKQKAGAQKKAADAIEKQRPKEKIENAAQKIAELSSKMNSAQKQMERLSQQVTELRGAIDGLASAAGSAAAAAGNVASAANNAIKSVERRIKACEKSIDKLRR